MRTDSSRREYAQEKPEDVYRILVTGPSFAFGWGSNYEEIFPSLIEAELRVPGKRVEVMNLGTPSQGSAHQLCWIEKVGYAYEPDLVLHVSYGNEVNPVATSCPTELECPTIESGNLVPVGVGPAARAKAFFKRFAIVFYGYYAVNSFIKPEPARDATRSLYAEGETATGHEASFEPLAESYAEHTRFLKSILGQQTQVAFIYLPFSFIVHPADIARFPAFAPADIPVLRARIAQGVSAIEHRGIRILDTLPPLTQAANHERLYYWLDIHFTPTGNRVVAEAAIPFVQAIIDSKSAPADL